MFSERKESGVKREELRVEGGLNSGTLPSYVAFIQPEAERYFQKGKSNLEKCYAIDSEQAERYKKGDPYGHRLQWCGAQTDETFYELRLREEKQAKDFFTKAGELGDSRGYVAVGDYYLNRKRNKKIGSAIHWYKKAAELGDPDACQKIGDIYHNWTRKSTRESKSQEWYKKAEELKELRVKDIKTGDAYYYGQGVEVNKAQAFECYMKALERGNIRAWEKIKDAYFDGVQVNKAVFNNEIVLNIIEEDLKKLTVEGKGITSLVEKLERLEVSREHIAKMLTNCVDYAAKVDFSTLEAIYGEIHKMEEYRWILPVILNDREVLTREFSDGKSFKLRVEKLEEWGMPREKVIELLKDCVCYAARENFSTLEGICDAIQEMEEYRGILPDVLNYGVVLRGSAVKKLNAESFISKIATFERWGVSQERILDESTSRIVDFVNFSHGTYQFLSVCRVINEQENSREKLPEILNHPKVVDSIGNALICNNNVLSTGDVVSFVKEFEELGLLRENASKLMTIYIGYIGNWHDASLFKFDQFLSVCREINEQENYREIVSWLLNSKVSFMRDFFNRHSLGFISLNLGKLEEVGLSRENALSLLLDHIENNSDDDWLKIKNSNREELIEKLSKAKIFDGDIRETNILCSDLDKFFEIVKSLEEYGISKESLSNVLETRLESSFSRWKFTEIAKILNYMYKNEFVKGKLITLTAKIIGSAFIGVIDYGRGVITEESSPKLALRFYESAGAAGNIGAMLRAGKICKDMRDIERSKKWYKKAAMLGSSKGWGKFNNRYSYSANEPRKDLNDLRFIHDPERKDIEFD